MNGRYSNIKALRFPERIRAIRDGRPAGPVHLQLVLSDLCNQSCSFCGFRDPSYSESQLFHVDGNYNPNRKLTLPKIVEILDDAKELGVKAIQLTGGGEPTIHPDFDRIVTEIRARGFKWGLITNGVRLAKVDVSDASWVRVSIDAANAATYSRIRNVPQWHFDRAIAALAAGRHSAGFVVTAENWREVVEATRLYKSIGASSVRIAPHFTAEKNLEFYESAAPLVIQAMGEESDGFRVFSRFFDKYAEIRRAPRNALCGYQYFTTFVGADENLYRCCIYAYNPRGLLGSLRGRRLRDVWPEVVATFGGFDARKCDGCHYQDVNETLAYALSDGEIDEEFV